MKFSRITDPMPIPASLAVERGVLLVNWPVRLIMLAGFVGAYVLSNRLPSVSLTLAISAIPCAWLWWSYFVPQWRQWALGSGADPEELQYLAEDANLVWPQGSFLERTEFRRDRR